MNKEEFFTRIIEGYLFHDLKNMAELKQKRGEPAGAAGYPMLATLCSGIELLGSVFQQEETYNRWNGQKYFNYYWVSFLEDVNPRYRGFENIFWNLIRHGVAHTYFAKVGVSVTKSKPRAHLVKVGEALNVDCTTFYRDLLKAYKKSRKLLKNSDITNTVQDNINSVLKESELDSSKHLKDIPLPHDEVTTASAVPFTGTYTAIPPNVLKELRKQTLQNNKYMSNASISRPIGEIKMIKTRKTNKNE